MNNRESDDAEDTIEEKKTIKKMRKESVKIKDDTPETQEILEYALNDFREFESLKQYKNLKFLTLNNQNIQSLETIIKSLSCLHILEFLCLNDNQITSLNHIEVFKNLKELNINFNQITKIENIDKIESLEKVWLCENKIEKIENLPKNIKNLWIASNLINSLDESIIQYEKLEEINLANNFIIEFEDLDILASLKELKTLYFSDPNFGENPLCSLNNYRVFLINMLPNLEIVDAIKVTSEERKESSSIYSKKSLFYIIKIKSLNRLCKNILTSLKSYLLFFLMFKTLQINFFNKRIKMLEYIEYDRTNLIQNPDTSEEEKSLKSEEFKEILKEKASSLEKLNKCLKNYETMNENFKSIKDYIGEINDFMIINTFYELETGGNIRLEPGTIDDKWASNCLELVRTKISQTFFTKNNIKSMNILKIFKIFNKKQKILYDSIYDTLLEKYGKFGEEKKCYENTFLYLESNDLEQTLKIILNSYEGYEGEIIVSNYLDKIEEIRLQSNKNKKYLIVCKWIILESGTDLSETYSEDTPLNKIISGFVDKNKSQSNTLSVYKVCNSDKSKKVILVKNKYICLPEFLIEYTYTYQNFNINNNVSIDNYIVSPYTSKNDFKTDPFVAIENCLKKMGESHINRFIDYSLIEKYKNIKPFSIEELNTTSSLFFAKATIIKFMQKCFKYSNVEDFSSEFAKINDKIEEINALNFSNMILKEVSDDKQNFEKLKTVNLFNSQLKEKDLSQILDKLLMIEELCLSNNALEIFNFKDINNTLKKIDLSHNKISMISNFNSKLFTLLEYVDIDFNHIFSPDQIKEFFKLSGLKKFSFHFNPLPSSFLTKIKDCHSDNEKLRSLFFTEEKHSILEEIHKIDLENETIKNVDIIYNSYSFSNRYAFYTKNSIFREKCNNLLIPDFKEKNKCIILSKKKLKTIPSLKQTDLKILFLNANKLQNIENLHNLINLEELYIHNNNIKNLETLLGQKPLINLKKIDLSNNEIISLRGISVFKNLLYINVENNFLSTLRCKDTIILGLEEMENLLEIHASCNHISNLRECSNLRKLPKLIVLDLTSNEVSKSQDFRFYMIYYLTKLRVLNRLAIERNETIAAKEYFDCRVTPELLESKLGSDNTSELTELDLSSCKLKDNDNIFTQQSYPKVKKLVLNKNLFSNFRIFGNLPNLIHLYLNYNVFEKIYNKADKPQPSKGILGLQNLETLEMCGNNINDLTGIHILKSIKILVFKENSISKFDYFDGLPNLVFLDLSFNKIRSLEKGNIGFLPSLKTLILDNNYLKNVNSLAKISSLNFLSIDNNKIQDISLVEKLAEHENLRELNLNNNLITKNYNYRQSMIRKFLILTKLDNYEISNEERESANIENNLNVVGDQNKIILPQNIQQNLNNIEKYPVRVNFVNLDLMFGGGFNKNNNDDLGIIKNQLNSNAETFNVINLPQINIQNFNNNNQKHNKGKFGSVNNSNITSNANSQNKNTYRSQKIKLNSIPLEVISNNNLVNNNDNFNHLFSKVNLNSNRIEGKVKRTERPKSKK